MATNDELAGAMARDVLSPLMALGGRCGLLETLESYLQEGSIAGVAAQTYRHRNTIRNRLRVVEEVTGLDLSRPCDTTLLALATAWLKTPSGRQFVGSLE